MQKLKIFGIGLICLSCLHISCRDASSQSESASQKTEMALAEKTETTEKIKATFIELGSMNCVPCKMMAPIVEEIRIEYTGQVKVIFYDVWKPEGRPYAAQYKIRAIPTQVFLDANGKEYFRHEGYFPKDEIISVLKKAGVE